MACDLIKTWLWGFTKLGEIPTGKQVEELRIRPHVGALWTDTALAKSSCLEDSSRAVGWVGVYLFPNFIPSPK